VIKTLSLVEDAVDFAYVVNAKPPMLVMLPPLAPGPPLLREQSAVLTALSFALLIMPLINATPTFVMTGLAPLRLVLASLTPLFSVDPL